MLKESFFHMTGLVTVYLDHPEGQSLDESHTKRDDPDQDDDSNGAGEFGHGLREEGITNREIPFHSEGGYG